MCDGVEYAEEVISLHDFFHNKKKWLGYLVTKIPMNTFLYRLVHHMTSYYIKFYHVCYFINKAA